MQFLRGINLQRKNEFRHSSKTAHFLLLRSSTEMQRALSVIRLCVSLGCAIKRSGTKIARNWTQSDFITILCHTYLMPHLPHVSNCANGRASGLMISSHRYELSSKTSLQETILYFGKSDQWEKYSAKWYHTNWKMRKKSAGQTDSLWLRGLRSVQSVINKILTRLKWSLSPSFSSVHVSHTLSNY